VAREPGVVAPGRGRKERYGTSGTVQGDAVKTTEQRTAEELQKGHHGAEEYWPWPRAEAAYSRLEDYITLSRSGEKVKGSVELSRRSIRMNIDSSGRSGPSAEMEAYLLLGTYRFSIAGKVHEVSKVYAFGSAGEDAGQSDRSRKVANERLAMDYARLRDGRLPIEEKYFA
jgi:hypothetical protein